MELLAHARIVMWEGGSLWVTDATAAASRERKHTDLHAHHAIQITFGLGGRFRLKTTNDEIGGDAVAVAPDVGHIFEAEGLMALLFVEPESRNGRAILAEHFKGAALAAIPPSLLNDSRARIAAAFRAPPETSRADLINLGQDLISRLSSGVRADVPDLRVRKAAAWAAKQLDRRIGLTEAAEAVNLSPGRLRHLFVEHTGLPFKTYLLWLRLTRAVEHFAAGASLTQAAHDAGFSDSAHLSRTFRRMFGISPAALRIT